MPSSSELIGDGTAKITIEIPPTDLQREYLNAARRIAQRRKIPGFRPGKAPPRVVERIFGEAAIKLDAIERLVPRTFDRALADQNLEMADQPEFEYPESEDGMLDFKRPFVYSGTVPLVPTVNLGDTRTIGLKRQSVEVGELEIIAQLEAIRSSRAEIVDIEEPERGLLASDIGRFDLREEIEGQARVEREGLAVSLENPGFAEGFTEQVLGMKVGDSGKFELAYPANSPATTLAGKAAAYDLKLVGITESTLPELTDEFASSIADVETLEQLRERMGEEMLAQRRREVDARLQGEALAALIDKSEFIIADRLIANQAHRLLDARVADLTRRGLALETFLAQRGLDQDGFHQQAHEDAADMMRNSLVISQYSRDHEITITNEQVNEHLEMMFAPYPAGERDTLRQHYLNQVGRESLHGQLLQERVLEHLLGAINIQEVALRDGEAAPDAKGSPEPEVAPAAAGSPVAEADN